MMVAIIYRGPVVVREFAMAFGGEGEAILCKMRSKIRRDDDKAVLRVRKALPVGDLGERATEIASSGSGGRFTWRHADALFAGTTL